MNIDSIKIYSADSISKPKRKNTNGHGFKENSVDLCNKKSVNRGYYGGSLTSFGAAANSYSDLGNRFCDKIFRSKNFQWLTETAEEQSGIGGKASGKAGGNRKKHHQKIPENHLETVYKSTS